MFLHKYGFKLLHVLLVVGVAGLTGCGGGGGDDGASTTSTAASSSSPSSSTSSQPASGLVVKINGVVATPAVNGEYSFPNGARLTVSGSALLGSSSTSTVDASGNKATTSSNIYAITASIYDVRFTAQPGYLTTITFPSAGVTIKLRYQSTAT